MLCVCTRPRPLLSGIGQRGSEAAQPHPVAACSQPRKYTTANVLRWRCLAAIASAGSPLPSDSSQPSPGRQLDSPSPPAASSPSKNSSGTTTTSTSSPKSSNSNASSAQPSTTTSTTTTSTTTSTTTTSSSQTDSSPATAATSAFQLNRIHVLVFGLIFIGGALFATITLQFTADMEFSMAITTVLRRVAKSVAFRQLVVIGLAILLVRYCLNGALKALASLSSSRIEWDKTKLFYILREVYQPLELLLLIAAICTLGDTFVPSLISVPKTTVSRVVKTIMSTSFILGFSSVVFNLKSRFCKENAWQAEMKGDVTQQRRWEAYDKLGTFIIYVMSFVLAIQAIGLEVTSVLAIGGIGGLAIGLAGREICENLLNGFLIMSTNPFEVGDEIHFFHTNKVVEGFVIDIGWYRTQIRSFEREVFVIPNSVFSKNIVLNITRKNREYRFYEPLMIRVQDVQKANSIIQDIRRILRNDPRIISKLHRRIFLDKITRDECKIYISFYLEAANRDAFMAIKQDMLLAFVDVVERNGAKLATPRTLVEMDKEVTDAIGSFNPLLAGIAAAQSMAHAQHQQQQAVGTTQLLPSAGTIPVEATTVTKVTASSSSPAAAAAAAVAASSMPVEASTSTGPSQAAPVSGASNVTSTAAKPAAEASKPSSSPSSPPSSSPSSPSPPPAKAAAESSKSSSPSPSSSSPPSSPSPSSSPSAPAAATAPAAAAKPPTPGAKPSVSKPSGSAVPMSSSPVAFSPLPTSSMPSSRPPGTPVKGDSPSDASASTSSPSAAAGGPTSGTSSMEASSMVPPALPAVSASASAAPDKQPQQPTMNPTRLFLRDIADDLFSSF